MNRYKQYVAKQYKINNENGPREQKHQRKTLSNCRKDEDEWKEHQTGENRFELQAGAEKFSKCGADNGKMCHAYIHQNRNAKLNEGRNKTKENVNNGESKKMILIKKESSEYKRNR